MLCAMSFLLKTIQSISGVIMQYRQGDVFLNKIEKLPELETKEIYSVGGQSEAGHIILAFGEVTGHKHAIHSKNAILFKAKHENKFFLMVMKPVDLIHEEHSTITLPVGNYEVIKQREYAPGKIKWVAD